MDDDRATLLGAFLEIANRLRGLDDDAPADLRINWHRRGLRTFAAEREAADATRQPPEAPLPSPGNAPS